MDVFQAIRERRSVRSYTGDPIPEDDLEILLKAARDAPSGKNLQPWRLIVVEKKDTLKELVPLCHNQGFVEDSGVFIAGLSEKDTKWGEIDLTIALDHLSLAAVPLDLGTCWIGAFDPEGMRERLEVPEGYDITICMTVGYPADDGESPVKKSLEELVCWESYEEKK